MNPVRRTAVLVDRYPLWLDALEQVLARLGIVTVGRAATSARALDLVARQRPDLLVGELDEEASGTNGASFLARARAHSPDLRAVVVSDFVEKRTVDDALAAGAAAYVSKTATADELTIAIRQAFDQSIYLPSRRASAPASALPASTPSLTKRELEILRLVADGALERAARPDAVGDRADGQVPPLERLPQAGRGEPDGGEPMGAGPQSAAGPSGRPGAASRVSAARVSRR